MRLEVHNGNIVGQTDLRDGLWHHIAVVLPALENVDVTQALLYVDGAVETISSSVPRTVRTSNSGIVLGGDFGGAVLCIDEFRIHPDAVDAAADGAGFPAAVGVLP